MNILTGRYTNEIISLTIMLLMTVALIAGQADATVHKTARSDSGYELSTLAAGLEAVMESRIIHADIELQVDFDQLLDAVAAGGSSQASHKSFAITMKSGD
ncbi:MAG: hypothetical protein OEO82_05925 [Gammaproteobacteria bacterium]|nr:hypothetical protein [Gammaproteobacteria bacterium]